MTNFPEARLLGHIADQSARHVGHYALLPGQRPPPVALRGCVIYPVRVVGPQVQHGFLRLITCFRAISAWSQLDR